ncbi:PE-PPE domain-containing protein [Mycobacterium sp. EPa45]|uniref:PE-PPE domain-containing protein n=1 Tax=Mycobacterium sp. EPa45 TaxID=1545728 RepID=UPI000699E9EA|nr:PE-PPE domain-containing protein [Mycobacterium sp. EPa45]
MSKRMRRASHSLIAATVVVAVGVSAPTPGPVASRRAVTSRIELSAVVTPGTATNPDATGIDDFYGVDWNATYGPTVVATFHLLRDQIQVDAIDDALKSNPEPNVVLTSGRGAGNASALISSYVRDADPTLYRTQWLLDNNIDRPNGGYATRLPFFAAVGVNPCPTPTTTGADIIDIGYEYAWNSDVPLYITNPLALLNSITEYAYRYRRQDSVVLPDALLNPDGSVNFGAAPGHYVVDTDGAVSFAPLSADNTTVYVTYKSNGLAILRPFRDFGGKGGQIFADLVEPALKVIIDAGYPNNDPLSAPDVYTPMRLFAPPKVLLTAAERLPAAIEQGIAAAIADLKSRPKAAPATNKHATTKKHATVKKAAGSTGTGHSKR